MQLLFWAALLLATQLLLLLRMCTLWRAYLQVWMPGGLPPSLHLLQQLGHKPVLPERTLHVVCFPL